MLGLVFPSGLMIITGYVSPIKEFGWLLSAFAGIVMCKIVYELTGVVSLLLFKGYAKLNDAEKLEWNNRGFSTFHALLVAVASLYLLLLSDLFDEISSNELIIQRRSTLSDTILGISIGYFLSDLVMILWHFPALGGMEFVLHHGLSMFSIFLSLVSGQGQVYIFMVLFTESTTPFVNLRWHLDVAGQKHSKLYTCNGVALFLGWLRICWPTAGLGLVRTVLNGGRTEVPTPVHSIISNSIARILLFTFFFYHMLTHFDQVKKVFPLGFYSLLAVPPVLATMNLFWFWKIAKGMMKTLSKARHSQ